MGNDNYREVLDAHEVVALHVCHSFTPNCKEQEGVLEEVYAALSASLKVRDVHGDAASGEEGEDVFGMATLCMYHGKEAFQMLEIAELGAGGLDIVVFREGEFDSVLAHWREKTYDAVLGDLEALLEPPVVMLPDDVAVADVRDFVSDPATPLVFLAVTDGSDDDDGALWTALHHTHVASADGKTRAPVAFYHAASIMRHEATFAVIRNPSSRVLRYLRESCESLTGEHPEPGAAPSCEPRLPLFRFFKNHAGHAHDHVDFPGAIAGGVDVEELRAFFESHTHPLWDYVDAHNHYHYSHMGMPFVQVFVDMGDPNLVAFLGAAFRPLTLKFRHTLRFGYLDAAKHGHHALKIGLVSLDSLPAVSIEDVGAGRHYALPPSADVTSPEGRAELEALADAVVAGTAKPTIISEPRPPPGTNRGPVIKVVGETFEDVVLDETRDVLVLFTAAWSGHARAFEHDWNDIGKTFARVTRVRVAIMDVDKNDIAGPGHGNRLVFHPPHVFLYRRGAKDRPISLRGVPVENVKRSADIYEPPSYEQTLLFFFNHTTLLPSEIEWPTFEAAYAPFIEDPDFYLPPLESTHPGHTHDEL